MGANPRILRWVLGSQQYPSHRIVVGTWREPIPSTSNALSDIDPKMLGNSINMGGVILWNNGQQQKGRNKEQHR